MTPQGNQHWESLRAIFSLDPQKQKQGLKNKAKTNTMVKRKLEGVVKLVTDPLVVTQTLDVIHPLVIPYMTFLIISHAWTPSYHFDKWWIYKQKK